MSKLQFYVFFDMRNMLRFYLLLSLHHHNHPHRHHEYICRKQNQKVFHIQKWLNNYFYGRKLIEWMWMLVETCADPEIEIKCTILTTPSLFQLQMHLRLELAFCPHHYYRHTVSSRPLSSCPNLYGVVLNYAFMRYWQRAWQGYNLLACLRTCLPSLQKILWL